MTHSDFAHTLQKTLKNHPELNTWLGHSEIRLPELNKIAQWFKFNKNDKMLEIGCGNGLTAAYFSKNVQELTATDLATVDHKNHVIGFSQAQKLFNLLKLTNIKLVDCSAEQLPFAPNSFDKIISLYTLEHIANKPQALAEIYRVAKPNSQIIITVPTAHWSLLYPLGFYVDFSKRVLRRITGQIYRLRAKQGSVTENKLASKVVVKDLKSFKQSYPHFPWPEPHGAYKNFQQELFEQRIDRWLGLFKTAGFKNLKFSALQVIPSHLLTTFLGKFGLTPKSKIDQLDAKLQEQDLFKNIAQFIAIYGEK